VQGPTADVTGTAVPFTSGVTLPGRHACEAFYGSGSRRLRRLSNRSLSVMNGIP